MEKILKFLKFVSFGLFLFSVIVSFLYFMFLLINRVGFNIIPDILVYGSSFLVAMISIISFFLANVAIKKYSVNE